MPLIPLPAFSDNYIWVLHDDRRALAVDPGEADGLLAWLAANDLVLDTLLLTHHHGDHTGGVEALRQATGARVFGPRTEALPEPLSRVGAGQTVEALGLRFEVIEVPGHTAGHIAYFCEAAEGAPLLFCGDTLFSGGCGRLFEGTPAQMRDSLERLAALPSDTRVCCAHEYTLSNLRFARAVEPDNRALADYEQTCKGLRERDVPTLPARLGSELEINPFLRSRVPAVRAAVARHSGAAACDDAQVFAQLREWKNGFQ